MAFAFLAVAGYFSLIHPTTGVSMNGSRVSIWLVCVLALLFTGALQGRLVRWDGTNGEGVAVASGTYLYTLYAGSGSVTKRCILLR